MNIPYGKQDITEDDLETVIKTLKSDFITQGPTVGDFEKAVKEKCSAKYAFATNSATSFSGVSGRTFNNCIVLLTT